MKPSPFWETEAGFTHALFENARIGMTVVSTRDRFLDVNRAFCRFLGYSKQELLGKTVKDVTHPDDWGNCSKRIRQLYSGLPSIRRYEKRYLHKNGKVLWGEANVYVIHKGGGKPRYTIAQIVDITERKKTEEALRLANERFRVALAESPITVFSQDRELRYTWIYNSVMPLKVEDILGKRDSDLLTAADAKCRMRVKKTVLQTGVGRRAEVVAHLNGRVVIHDLRAEPLRDGNGNIIGIIGASTNISERKRMEDELHKTNKQLEEQVNARTLRLRKLTGELLHIEHQERRRIAHILHDDLQQQLAAMKFLCAQLKDGSPAPSVIRLADRLLGELDHAIGVTRTLSVDLRPHVLNHMTMGKCIEWLAGDVRNRMGLNVKVRLKGVPDIASDEMRIFAFEAVRELLLNAVKHSKVKSVEVLFSLMGANRVKLQVRDKGVGFDPKQNHKANRHFGHFSIQERAELLGGQFEVISHPGKGTCATLILPRGKSSH